MDRIVSLKQYFESLSERELTPLLQLRATVLSIKPDLEEYLYYQMPAFRYQSKPLICYAAFKNHYSLFTCSKGVLAYHPDDVLKKGTGSTIQSPFNQALPIDLITEVIYSRIAEIDMKLIMKKGKKNRKNFE